MANIGDTLTKPESGWKRIDDSHDNITYKGYFALIANSSAYNGSVYFIPESATAAQVLESSINFKFTGDKIRIISSKFDGYSDSVALIIDGEKTLFSFKGSSTSVAMKLLVEKTGLSNSLHTVEIRSNDGVRFSIDAIDISENGDIYNINYVEPNHLKSVNIGNLKQVLTTVNEKIENKPGKTIVKEVPNPLTMMPLEYGTASASSSIESIENDSIIDLSYISGNVPIEDGAIKLEANKRYQIIINSKINNKDCATDIVLYDVNKDELIDDICLSIGSLNCDINYSNTTGIGFLDTIENMDLKLKLTNSINASIPLSYLSITVQEVRNNPVNQYGGFESEILFEGKADSIGEYSLSENIENYDFLLVDHSVDLGDTSNVAKLNNCIKVKDINYKLTHQFMYQKCLDSNVAELFYTFNDSKILAVTHTLTLTYTSIQITKIIGIKGQLPSLLSGGEF